MCLTQNGDLTAGQSIGGLRHAELPGFMVLNEVYAFTN